MNAEQIARANAEAQRLRNAKEIKREPAKPKTPATETAAKTADPPPKPAENLEGYFDLDKRRFWIVDSKSEWISLDKADMAMHLRSKYYNPFLKTANTLNEVERKKHDIIMKHNVHFAGEVAGYPAGIHQILNNRILVTRGARIPATKYGKFPLIRNLVKQMFGEEGKHFYAWMKAAFMALEAGPPFSPGQALAIAGERGCGKSLLQNLITEMLGGREAKPFRYFAGKTDFNHDLLKAEHLKLDDEIGRSDHRARREFGSKIKETVANQRISCHPKGSDAFMLEPFWRITISLNDNAESLMILPPMDDDIDDKIFLLRAKPHDVPYPSDAYPDRHSYWRGLVAEIPAYLHALKRWEIPEAMRDVRYGVRAHQNADLLFALASLSPEMKLWNLIQQSGILANSLGGWTGTAHDMESELAKSSVNGQAEKLFYFSTACGVYLSRLAKTLPGNVARTTKAGNQTFYEIAAPK